MLKIPISLMICLLVLLSLLCINPVSSNVLTSDVIFVNDEQEYLTRIQDVNHSTLEEDSLLFNSGYKFVSYEPTDLLLRNQDYPLDDDVELLWNVFIGAGEDEGNKYTALDRINYLLINNDTIPDILTGRYALDGETGEIIYKFERGVFYGLGDVNNDGKAEIITGNDRNMKADIYCINPADGSIIWKNQNINSVCIDSVSIGDVTGDSTNEVVVGMSDVYCFNGINGNIIWTKHLTDGWLCSIAISDVNNDGKNEIIAGTFNNDPRVCCLDGDKGEVLWEYERNWIGGASFRTLCIDNLNNDPYQEIIAEGNPNSYAAGLLCLSGYDGKILWTWEEEPRRGSFQTILSADLIPDIPGKEIIAGGVGGIYCLYGGDNPSVGGRVLWHVTAGIIMSAAVGDIDGDGSFDVVGSSVGTFGNQDGGAHALKGQYGSLLWFQPGVGNDFQDSTICVDFNNDFTDEVVSLSMYYENKRLFYVSALQSNFPSENHIPFDPIVNGPMLGSIRETHEYSAISIDADNDNLYYYFNWGDGTGDISTGKEPGESSILSHSWMEEGTYIIKVKTIDDHGAESDWTRLEITMPKYKTVNNIYQKFHKMYLLLKFFYRISN